MDEVVPVYLDLVHRDEVGAPDRWRLEEGTDFAAVLAVLRRWLSG